MNTTLYSFHAEPLEVDVGYQEVSVDAEGAQSFGIVALSIIGVIIVLLVAADALTFGMQLAVLKVQRKFSLKFTCKIC